MALLATHDKVSARPPPFMARSEIEYVMIEKGLQGSM